MSAHVEVFGAEATGLTFAALRAANVTRQAHYRANNPFAEWSAADWMTAIVGELGEAANILKKIRREDFSLDEKRQELADELADVQAYLDLLANKLGIDLGAATVQKFNTVSARVGSPVRLACEEWPDGPRCVECGELMEDEASYFDDEACHFACALALESDQ